MITMAAKYVEYVGTQLVRGFKPKHGPEYK
jgi:hypothetical protein